MFGLTGILSGPLHFLQIAAFFKDTYNTVHDLQTAAREVRTMKSLARGVKASLKAGAHEYIDQKLIDSRIGLVGQSMSTHYEARLAEQGVKFNFVDGSMEITNLDILGLGGEEMAGMDFETFKQHLKSTVAQKFDIPESNISITDTGAVKFDPPDKLSMVGKIKATKFYRTIIGETDIGSVSGWLASRVFAKKAGFVDAVFHPIKFLKEAGNRKIYDAIASLLERRGSTGADTTGHLNLTDATANDKIQEESTNTSDSATNDVNRQTNTARANSQANAVDTAKGAVDTPAVDPAQSPGEAFLSKRMAAFRTAHPRVAGAFDASVHAGKAAGIVTMIVTVLCLIKALGDQGPLFQWLNTVIPAIKDMQETLSYASQIMSGDISMTDLGAFSALKFYQDDLPTKDQDGNTISDSSTSYIEQSPVIRCEMDRVNCNNDNPDMNNQVLPQLLNVSDGNLATVIMNAMRRIPAIGSTIDTALTAACSTGGQWVMTVLGFVTDFTPMGLAINGLFTVATSVGPGATFIGNAINSLADMLNGNPLDTTYQTAANFGTIDTYGGKFNAGTTGVQSDGGVSLGKEATVKVTQQANEYLAEQYSKEPLLAKLFDPTDYRSALSRLGRAANINYSPGLGNQLANTVKMFAALPSLGFSLFIGSPANTAMAAAGSPTWDYNVPTVAFNPYALDNMNDATNDANIPGSSACDLTPVSTTVQSGESVQMINTASCSTDIYSNVAIVMNLIENGAESVPLKNGTFVKHHYKDDDPPDFPGIDIKYDELAEKCLYKKIGSDGNVTDADFNGNLDGTVGSNPETNNGGMTFAYMAGTDNATKIETDWGEKDAPYLAYHCSELQDPSSKFYDLNFVRVAMYVGMDWNIVMSQSCSVGDVSNDNTLQACQEVGIGANSN